MYFLVMNPFCWQEIAIGLLAASASRQGGMGREDWWRSICSSYFLKIYYFIRKYLGVWGFFVVVGLILFGWFF